MTTGTKSRNGGQILIDALRIHGVERAFCVPGESYLAALDALHDAGDDIELIVCRQEGGAAYMAEAYGKLTGKPGICFVTRGPGATNASVGVHTAFQDSTPMILFIGQVARDQVEREAFQEIDYRRMFGQMAKWVVQIDDAARIPELVSQAFHRAVNGRPGPVVVALPEDMLTDRVDVADAPAYKAVEMHAGQDQLDELRSRLERAERPLVIVGGAGWTAGAVADIRAFSEAMHLPIAASFRCQDLFDNTHPNYAGDLGLAAGPKLIQRIKDSDLLIVIGARLGEMTTGSYSLIDIPVPKQALVHVHAGAEELGRVYHAALPINASAAAFARQAAGLAPIAEPRWAEWTRQANADYRENLTHTAVPGPVQMGDIMAWLRGHLPADAILTTGAGNYSAWAHRFYQYRTFRTQLGPTNGSMGYGVPAAIAAKLCARERAVIAFCRRRLLPDERPGTGDRHAVRRPSDLPGDQQRHVWNDPHASGAALSGSGVRHAIDQSGFRGAGACLWAAWRNSRDDGRLRPCLQAGRKFRSPSADRNPYRRGSPDAENEPEPDPRTGAGTRQVGRCRTSRNGGRRVSRRFVITLFRDSIPLLLLKRKAHSSAAAAGSSSMAR
ncbi:acetolactate synthase large subunit IlvB [Sinorhizobium fredii USDA 257]|uniref:Acetolactate synthase large subunit IlvB n=1 Tax=Sinorhizobium fredii (strain USDA 257) TaxID=1185652 RepID=I3X5G1_SINF2|nr:acetolactate synthase large subunit IlvB [Sinorhizobium fredii USDA 257]